MKVFHHSHFSDIEKLAALKQSQQQSISVCIPTLDEGATIGPIVETIRRDLMERCPVVDEVLVIDSDSSDDTVRIAENAGACVWRSAGIAAENGTYRGKGENLWKALQVARGTLVCFIDGDISNFSPQFVTGLVGPLLNDPTIAYVKAFYERPIDQLGELHPTGGGRVSEILVRPLLSLFYPDLTAFVQPLAGEYAARREVFRSLPFPTGYGVELAHLIDLITLVQSGGVAQVDLDQRVHRNRGDEELGRMAFGILQVLFRRLQRDGKLSLSGELPDVLRLPSVDGLSLTQKALHLPEPERPALDWLRRETGNLS